MRQKKAWTLALSWAAVVAVAGCGTSVMVSTQEEMPAGRYAYRRMPGSSAKIFAEAKGVLDRMGFAISGERENQALMGELEVARKPVPVLLYLTISRGDRVTLRFYNLTPAEEEEWTAKVFHNIRAAVMGTPAEREKRGRPRRG